MHHICLFLPQMLQQRLKTWYGTGWWREMGITQFPGMKEISYFDLEANTFRHEQMTHMLQMAFPNEISSNENVFILILISLRFEGSTWISPPWFRYSLLSNRHHAITRTNVNRGLCCHMTSLGHDEFNTSTLVQVIGCCLINIKLLPGPMLTKISVAIYRPQWGS